MIVTQYELAIELERGGEWLRYEIEVDPPLMVDGAKSESFPMEMRYDEAGELVFYTEHPLTDDLKELERILAKEIINEEV